jgi:hypothetical protein
MLLFEKIPNLFLTKEQKAENISPINNHIPSASYTYPLPTPEVPL